MGVLAADHALVDRLAGAVEERSSLLDVEERVRDRLALAVGDDGAVAAFGDLSLPRLVAVELRRHDSFAAGDGEELVAETDQPPRGNAEAQPHAVAADLLHLHHAALARAHPLGDCADRRL